MNRFYMTHIRIQQYCVKNILRNIDPNVTLGSVVVPLVLLVAWVVVLGTLVPFAAAKVHSTRVLVNLVLK
jgi:hypothetical protein